MNVQKAPFSCRRDGLTIRGHAWGSAGAKRAVILSHGFLANERSCRAYAKVLAGLGYLAITYDFCGGGIVCRSDGRRQDMTVLTEKEDLKAVIRAVREQFGIADISLLGCSQGGFVSAMTAAELGAGAIRSLMLFYPALCIPDDARKGQMMFYKFDPQHIPDLLGWFPMKLGGDYARCVVDMDPYREIAGYGGPILLLHGTADPIVDISYARRFKELYPDCAYTEIEGGGHGFKRSYEQRSRALLRAFAEKN